MNKDAQRTLVFQRYATCHKLVEAGITKLHEDLDLHKEENEGVSEAISNAYKQIKLDLRRAESEAMQHVEFGAWVDSAKSYQAND